MTDKQTVCITCGEVIENYVTFLLDGPEHYTCFLERFENQ